jgi:hypothetical protein
MEEKRKRKYNSQLEDFIVDDTIFEDNFQLSSDNEGTQMSYLIFCCYCMSSQSITIGA